MGFRGYARRGGCASMGSSIGRAYPFQQVAHERDTFPISWLLVDTHARIALLAGEPPLAPGLSGRAILRGRYGRKASRLASGFSILRPVSNQPAIGAIGQDCSRRLCGGCDPCNPILAGGDVFLDLRFCLAQVRLHGDFRFKHVRLRRSAGRLGGYSPEDAPI